MCFPLRTDDMRALGVANQPLILPSEEQATFTLPLHSLGDCSVVGGVSFLLSNLLLYLVYHVQCFGDFFTYL